MSKNGYVIQWELRSHAINEINCYVAKLLGENKTDAAKLLLAIREDLASQLADAIQNRYIIRTPRKR